MSRASDESSSSSLELSIHPSPVAHRNMLNTTNKQFLFQCGEKCISERWQADVKGVEKLLSVRGWNVGNWKNPSTGKWCIYILRMNQQSRTMFFLIRLIFAEPKRLFPVLCVSYTHNVFTQSC